MTREEQNEAAEAVQCAIINLDNVVKMAPALQWGRTLLPVVRHQMVEALKILESDRAEDMEKSRPFPAMPNPLNGQNNER